MLYLVPTPIGNLEDMTLRGIRVLKEADLILCEDTRQSIKLLNHFEIKKPLMSYHQHNEISMSEMLATRLKSGENIALISDAGTPGISDPGEILVKMCIREGLEYCVLPGASAIIPAIVSSNIQNAPFCFVGFVDRNKIKKALEPYKEYGCALVFYESPHRILSTLKAMREVFGDRNASVIREISKLHEEKLHNNLDNLILYYEENEPRGEFVIVVEGYQKPDINYSPEDVQKMAYEKLKSGERSKDIAKELSKISGIDRNEIYKYLQNL